MLNEKVKIRIWIWIEIGRKGSRSFGPILRAVQIQIKILKKDLQWLSMVWDKIPMIWDIIDLANYSLDLQVDMTKFDYHENSNANDTKN